MKLYLKIAVLWCMQTSTLMLVEVVETLTDTSRRSLDVKDFGWITDKTPNTPKTYAYLTSLSKHYLIIPIYSKTVQLQPTQSIHSVHTHCSYTDNLNMHYCAYIPVTTTVTNTAIIFIVSTVCMIRCWSLWLPHFVRCVSVTPPTSQICLSAMQLLPIAQNKKNYKFEVLFHSTKLRIFYKYQSHGSPVGTTGQT